MEVVFQNEYMLTVEGVIHANGLVGDSVLFTVADTTGYVSGSYIGWHGLRIYYASDTCKLNYCIVEYSKGYGIYCEESLHIIDNCDIRYNSTGTCTLAGSDLDINSSIIERNRGIGLYIHTNSSLNATDIIICENANNGISIFGDCVATLNNITINDNEGYGLFLLAYSSLSYTGGSVSNNLNGGFAIDNFCHNVILQDLTIQGNSKSGNGGGIFCDYGSSVNVANLLIDNNSATDGGGIFLGNGSTMVLDSVTISNNEADLLSGLGGGIYNQSSNITLSNTSIVNCISYRGGGIYAEGDEYEHPHINGNNVLIDNNSAISGGGIYCSYGTIVLDSITVSNNDADLLSGWGGGIYTDLGGLTLSNSSIFNCDAWKGGGIYIHNTWEYPGQNVELDSTIIEFCNADFGGGLYVLLEDANMTINRSQIHDNDASGEGGGIYVDWGPAGLDILHSTFYNNQATGDGNALMTYSQFIEPSLNNCIVWGHPEPAISSGGPAAMPDIIYSDIQGSGIYSGTGNINQDPLFVDPGNGDFHLTWSNPPFPLPNKSPCIDMGNPSSPPDPDGTVADMGAHYYHQNFTPIAGNINDTLKCSESPYYVMGDLTIPTGEKLVIEPCVHLVFMDDYRMNVEGQLLALGNIADNILFYPADIVTGWQGIRFLNQNTNGQDSSKLEFCKIKYAKADGPGEDAKGGGIYCNNSSEVALKNSELSYNQAEKGGGIYCNSLSNPLISSTSLVYNQAVLGGGIYGDSSNFQLADCNIYYNTATDKGGGIYVRASSVPIINDNNINNNTALFGGGIYADSSNCQVSSCFVQNNQATTQGGGIYCNSGSIPVFTSDTISYNQSDGGGGLYAYGSKLQVNDCYVYQNQAINGGGMYGDSCEYQMTGGGFSGNVAEANAGGIYQRLGIANISNVQFNNNEGTFAGGGIYCGGANLTLSDLIFINNDVS